MIYFFGLFPQQESKEKEWMQNPNHDSSLPSISKQIFNFIVSRSAFLNMWLLILKKKNLLKIMSNSVEVEAERRMCKGRGKKQQKQSQGTEKLNRDFSWVRREYSLLG